MFVPHWRSRGRDVGKKAAPPPDALRQLVEKAQAGDTEAFAKLYRRYRPVIFKQVRFRTPNLAIAEDITSETFLQAYTCISQFRWHYGKDIGAWLHTIARNLCFDYYRSAKTRFETSVADMLDVEGIDITWTPVETFVMQTIENDILLELLKRLREKNYYQYICIVLRYLCELSVEETAERLDKTEGAVRTLQCRAMARLRGWAKQYKLEYY